MTRVLGAERVPAGFTITTEACVAYMNAEKVFPDGLKEQVATALGALEEHAGKRLGDADDPLLVSVRSGARESMPGMMDTVLNLGMNDDSVVALAQKTEQRALRVGLLPALRADVRQRRRGHRGRALRGRDQGHQAGSRGVAGHRAGRRRATRADRDVQGLLRLPGRSTAAAGGRHPGGLRLLDRQAGDRVPPHQPPPRRLGHGGQRPADGLRQQGGDVGIGRRVLARRGHRRA